MIVTHEQGFQSVASTFFASGEKARRTAENLTTRTVPNVTPPKT